MRKLIRGSALVVLALVALTAIAFAHAQEVTEEPTPEVTIEPTEEATMEPTEEATDEPTPEATMEPTAEATMEATQEVAPSAPGPAANGTFTCSSDLVASLYVAERYLGYGELHDQMTQDGMDTVDVTRLDKGQFGPLFDSMMAMPSESDMTDEDRAAISNMMMMDDATLNEALAAMQPAGIDMSTISTLGPASVAGEPADCAALRAELSRFFTVVALRDLGVDVTMATEESPDTDTMENVNFSTTLSGANEVPGPGDDDGTGTATVTIDFTNGQICYNVSVQNVTLPAAAMHIHRGNAGESGDVVVPFDKAPDDTGNASGCVLADADLMTSIANTPASFYVNVHTSDFPDGAVRGQVAG